MRRAGVFAKRHGAFSEHIMKALTLDLKKASARRTFGASRELGRNPRGERIGLNRFHLEWNGRPWLPVMGEFQYSRYPAEYWEEELLKIKAGGVEIVPTYAFWNHHEEEEGVFDWSGRRDLRRFVKLCAKHRLWVVMRVGPFCHGEARNGGLPDWLYGQGFEVRRDDPAYLFYVRRLYREIGRQLRGLLFKDGGPVLGLQCENEFMASAAPWETTHNPAMDYTPKGEGGRRHMRLLKRMAIAAGLEVPLYVCTGWGGSPVDPREFLPMFGGYGYYAWLDEPSSQAPTGFYLFRDMPNRKAANFNPREAPFACCEIGGGMQVFYKNRPVVPPESVEAMHIAQLGSGSNVMGYYVYHGGTNPVGRSSFLNEHRCPRISYDFQAPLGEFGQRRAHYDLLRRQFLFLRDFGDRLAPMEVLLSPAVARMRPTDSNVARWAVRAKEGAGFLFLHNFQDHVALPARKGLIFELRDRCRGRVRIPVDAAGLDLNPGVSAILPFRLDMDGLLLESATAQPLSRIEHEGGAHWFFFVPEGFPAEYAFASRTFASLETWGATRQTAGALTRIKPRPGTGCLLLFHLHNGKRVFVTTLTDEQSRHFWKAKIAGRERVFLSKDGLVFFPKKIEIHRVREGRMSVAVYPPLAARRKGREKDGIFQRYAWNAPARKLLLAVRRISAGKVAVRVPRDALRGEGEVYLRIKYLGDTGSAYLDGRLIHDHFGNGTTWEIGLRPFAPRILQTELVLVLTPSKKGKARVKYSGMATMEKVSSNKEAMAFCSIRAVAERRAVLPAI